MIQVSVRQIVRVVARFSLSSGLGFRVKFWFGQQWSTPSVRVTFNQRRPTEASVWFGPTRSNRVDSVNPGQHSKLTQSTKPVNSVDPVNSANFFRHFDTKIL
ncbi:hypothetical protein Hanom_Chr02g00137991 [Helianthus anomalus]